MQVIFNECQAKTPLKSRKHDHFSVQYDVQFTKVAIFIAWYEISEFIRITFAS